MLSSLILISTWGDHFDSCHSLTHQDLLSVASWEVTNLEGQDIVRICSFQLNCLCFNLKKMAISLQNNDVNLLHINTHTQTHTRTYQQSASATYSPLLFKIMSLLRFMPYISILCIRHNNKPSPKVILWQHFILDSLKNKAFQFL